MTQIELHEAIDRFLLGEVPPASSSVSSFFINIDSRRYFYYRADEPWLQWLWSNGFLDEIRKPSVVDITNSSYSMPELDYLDRMVQVVPEQVVEIINSIQSSEDSFNPEVLDRFIHMLEFIPAECIHPVLVKMKNERWVYLMRAFRESGYTFTHLVKKLLEAKAFDSLLELAEALLVLKKEDDFSDESYRYSEENSPFCLKDIGGSEIFEALVGLEGQYLEKAIDLLRSLFSRIVCFGGANEKKIFEFDDFESFYDVDIFTLELEDERGFSFRRNLNNLLATLKNLLVKAIASNASEPAVLTKIESKILTLPTSRFTWRLNLFTWAQNPEFFKSKLRDAFFRLFDYQDASYDIAGGPEYDRALKLSFQYFSQEDQRSYVANVFAYFTKLTADHPDQKWHPDNAWEILSTISEWLTMEEKSKCKTVFGKECDATFEPEPAFGGSTGGMVAHQAPADLAILTLDEIIQHLKTDWTPEKLKQEYKDDDFLRPRGPEGLGDALKKDFSVRSVEYLQKLKEFYDRDLIHPHYLTSIFYGVSDLLRNGTTLTSEQTDEVLSLLEGIRLDGLNKSFENETSDSWLSDWIGVHKVMTDVLLYLCEHRSDRVEFHTKHREVLKNLISYLLTIKQSPSKDDEKPERGEPYFVAINSVRGRAYEVFVVFVEDDGKDLAADVKEIFTAILQDESLAVRFMIGRYLATFYFRDSAFVEALFPQILPKNEASKKDIYLATWEGCLSSTLYKKLFDGLKDYYSYAISLDPKTYTDRRYSHNLDESLAIHLALAFLYLDLDFEDDLFVEFWANPNATRQHEFISFIGRSYIIRNREEDNSKSERIDNSKLLKLWDWVLNNGTLPEVFSAFSYWVNPDEEILADGEILQRMPETLVKSEGNIDWDSGLFKRLSFFVKKDPLKALALIRNYFILPNGNLNSNRRVPLFYAEVLKEALALIYQTDNADVKKEVINLINVLIEKGSTPFWDLKEVLK